MLYRWFLSVCLNILLSLVVCFERRINKNYSEFCASEIQLLCTGHGWCFDKSGTKFISLFDPPGTNVILHVGLDRKCKKSYKHMFMAIFISSVYFKQVLCTEINVLLLPRTHAANFTPR